MLKDAEDLMNMTDKELEEYSHDLDWIRSVGVTMDLDQDIEYLETMIEIEFANR